MKKQVYFYNKRKECGKKMSNIFITLKMTCLGVLDTKRTSQKTIEILTTFRSLMR